MSESFPGEPGGEQADRRRPEPPIFLFVGLPFALIGLGLLAGTAWSCASTRQFLGRAATAPGRVVELVRREGQKRGDAPTFAPLIRFEAREGRAVEFVGSPSSNPPAYSVGDEVRVLYDPSRPEAASTDGFFSLWGVALILGPLGAVFGGLGVLLLGLHARARRAEAARDREREALAGLRQTGRKVEAKVREVRRDFDDRFRLVAQWHDRGSGKVYVFESRPIGYDPAEFVRESVDVFIDPLDPRRYLVDTAFLPEMGNPAGPWDEP